MRQSVVFHILVVILLTFVGCESDADIDISAERKTVLFAFVESGDKCMIHAYQSIFFTETSSKIPLGENTTILPLTVRPGILKLCQEMLRALNLRI